MSNNEHQPGQREAELAAQGLSRRVFTRTLAILGITLVADSVAQGPIYNRIKGLLVDAVSPEEEELLNAEGVSEKLEEAAQKIAHEVNESGEELSDVEKMKKIIDRLGTVLFVSGVIQLISPKSLQGILDKDNNHIKAWQFAVLGVLSGLKYQLEDEHGREHLIAETEAGIKTFAFIAGAMTLGEGVNADISKVWEKAKGEKPAKKDLIALMNTLSVGISTVGTTLVNAPIARTMALDIANKGYFVFENKETQQKEEVYDEKGELVRDKEAVKKFYDKDGNEIAANNVKPAYDGNIMAVATSHNANVSGIAGFGNPPFMAVCEKYGFKEGMIWKMKTMWPLAIYSWVSATYKMNLAVGLQEGLSAAEAATRAVADTVSGLSNPSNICFFAETIVRSLGNAAKYATGKNLDEQDAKGIRIQIGEVIEDKLRGLFVDLPFAKEVGHGSGGIARAEDLEIKGADAIAVAFMDALKTENGHDEKAPTHENGGFADLLSNAIERKDYDELIAIGRLMGIPQIEILVKNLRDFHDDKKINKSPDKPQSWGNALNPVNIATRTSDINRIKGTVGHNLGDVINVFPFQAGCVPFLVPVFKDIIAGMEESGLTGVKKEIAIFGLIQFFSSVADNYVACKIGLELLPDQPEIALIASENPMHNPISNMSNLGQFSLSEFSLDDAIKKFGWHIDSSAAALAYSQGLKMASDIGIVARPQAPQAAGEHVGSVQPSGVEKVQGASRREIFKGIFN